MTSSLASLVLDSVVPEPVNLNPGLVLKSPLGPVRVRVRGTSAALQNLAKGATGAPTVLLVADLKPYTVAGEVSDLELKALLPEGVELVDLSPAMVSVMLEAKP
jgi:hypothetical protein